MTVLTVTAVLAMASSCQSLVAPMTIAKIAQHESGLDPLAQHQNRDGSTDYGLLQINDRNFGWLNLTKQTAMDPCRSIAAGAEVLTAYSRFNTGSPTRGITNGYAGSVQAVRFGPEIQPPGTPSEPRQMRDLLHPSDQPAAGKTERDLIQIPPPDPKSNPKQERNNQ